MLEPTTNHLNWHHGGKSPYELVVLAQTEEGDVDLAYWSHSERWMWATGVKIEGKVKSWAYLPEMIDLF